MARGTALCAGGAGSEGPEADTMMENEHGKRF